MRNLAHLDDIACVTLAKRGDGKAFSELVARYQDRIYRFLLRLTRSPDDALELTQDTFLRAYQGLERWRPDALFKTWLFRIARNIAFDRLRRDKLVEFVELEQDMDLPDTTAGPEAIFETAQRYRLLEAALERLPAEHREILLLREIEEMAYDEIAAVLNLNVGTVKSRLARARSALLDKLKHQPEVSR
ncbi:sigma-70 family RNA polymerase sigma factor [Noviherbaspirillum sp.]|uniref:sigma-70 family RNA polymerase sigma factor n=1 Tax=Noviherbaspirillum sp. TaxID=1926288 RepID=UPI002B45CEBB|nr:sigma-70 family RNA polymerase sigma factor [Noviherbaspirillum sp.]HJV79705.1 sigma-70 family RNA polymerase sigma factor [Noviherbaspirillum sp.]